MPIFNMMNDVSIRLMNNQIYYKKLLRYFTTDLKYTNESYIKFFQKRHRKK